MATIEVDGIYFDVNPDDEIEHGETVAEQIGRDLSGKLTDLDDDYVSNSYGGISYQHQQGSLIMRCDSRIYQESGFSRGEEVVITELDKRDAYYPGNWAVGNRAIILAIETLHYGGFVGCYLRILSGEEKGARACFAYARLERDAGNEPIPKGVKVNSLCRREL